MNEDRTHYYGDGCCVEPGNSDTSLSLVEQARVFAGEHDGHDSECERCLVAGLADEVERLRRERDEAVAALRESCDENRINAIAESAFLTCPADARVAALEAAARAYVEACDVLQGDDPPEDAWIEASGRYERLWALLDTKQVEDKE